MHVLENYKLNLSKIEVNFATKDQLARDLH